MPHTPARPVRRRGTPLAVAAVLVASATATVVLPGTAAAAPSPDAVIAEVYGGGGNSGATLTSDFVELGNRSGAPVTLDGFSVQYLPGSPSATSQWQATPLTGTLPAQGRYLVAQARGAGGTTALPAPDATGTIAMAAASGTVALVQGVELLTCRTSADCAADPRIRDLVGYGTAVVRETTPAPAGSATAALARPVALPDTDVNSADLASGDPTPTNAAGQTAGGGGGPQPPGGPAQPGALRIHDVQGTTRLSPVRGTRVEGVPGIVTAVRAFGTARGFWFQDPAPDADPRTSEALFVFTGATSPAVAVGDDVLVSGTPDEFRPGGATSPNQSVTQLGSAQVTVRSSGNSLPAAEVLTPASVPQAFTAEPGGDIEALALDPARFALDFYESRENMRVAIADARVVGPTTSFGELWVTSKPAQNPTQRGGTAYLSYADPNSGRLKIESLIPLAQRPFPVVDVNDRIAGTTAGVLDYDGFGGYTLLATELGQVVDGGLTPEVTRAPSRLELAVATYNVENLSPADEQAKFDRLARGIVTNLARPDVVGLEEVQDDNGPVNDAVVTAGQTLDRLVAAITAAGGPRYAYRLIDPIDDTNGGQPGGNIRNAFLFDPARVSFVDRPGGSATTGVTALPRRTVFDPIVSASPGLVDPQNPAWANSRKPLVGEFVFNRLPVLVVINHFASKGGDQPLHGRFQPPTRSSEVQRTAQARVLRQFVDQVNANGPIGSRFTPLLRTPMVVAGDLNDYPFSPALQILTQGGALTNPIQARPPGDRYTYVFEGNSQALDHILVGNVRRFDYDVVHTNAEFADQISDHDPQVIRLSIP